MEKKVKEKTLKKLEKDLSFYRSRHYQINEEILSARKNIEKLIEENGHVLLRLELIEEQIKEVKKE